MMMDEHEAGRAIRQGATVEERRAAARAVAACRWAAVRLGACCHCNCPLGPGKLRKSATTTRKRWGWAHATPSCFEVSPLLRGLAPGDAA